MSRSRSVRTAAMRRASFGLVVLVFGLAACSGLSATAKPTHGQSASAVQRGSLDIDGRQRTYRLFRPTSLSSGARAPLVVVLHGATMTADGVAGVSHFDDQARTAGFIVVYPEGIGESWNAGACCGEARVEGVDDVKFIDRLIERFKTAMPIDGSRVFVVGLSNGGMMAYRLACELSQSITAIASVAGTTAVATCHPTRPVSVLEIHGTRDELVPYAGGTVDLRPRFPDVFTSAPVTSVIEQWVVLDGCTGSPILATSGITKTSTWSNCQNRAMVALGSVEGGTHTYFGSSQIDPSYGSTPDATQTAWNFFNTVSWDPVTRK